MGARGHLQMTQQAQQPGPSGGLLPCVDTDAQCADFRQAQPGHGPRSLVLGTGPPLAYKTVDGQASPALLLSPDHMAGRGPDKLGAVRVNFLKWHFLMVLVVTSSGQSNPHCHGFSLGSTLSVNQCCPVTSLPRRDLSSCVPDTVKDVGQVYKSPWRSQYGHGHTCGCPGGCWTIEERQGVLSQVQAGLSVWCKCQFSKSSEPLQLRHEETEANTAPSPVWPSTSSRTQSPQYWDLTTLMGA